jgi:hypothetical protein
MKTTRLSDVRHRGGQGAVDNFRVPESRIEPTATPFDESIPQVGLVEGDPRFRLGLTIPRRAAGPLGGVFFGLTLAAENERAAKIGSNRKARRTIKSN